jgi:hypothetical protein
LSNPPIRGRRRIAATYGQAHRRCFPRIVVAIVAPVDEVIASSIRDQSISLCFE